MLLRLRCDSAGREIAWRDFYSVYAPLIGGFARNMGVRPDDVKDVVQELMLGFYAAAPKFVYDPSRGRFRGYLKTCVWRVFQDKLRARLRIDGRPVEEIDPGETQVEAAWNDVWDGERLKAALDIVRNRYLLQPSKARTFRAFEMYALLGRSVEDVAAELDLSVASVHQAKSRVSKAIRAALAQIEEENG